MHVSMEKIVFEDLGEKDLYAPLCQQFEIYAGSFQSINVGHRDAVNALHYKHVFIRVWPVDLWNVEHWRICKIVTQ